MILPTPSLQDGAEAASAQGSAPETLTPLINAPATVLWVGFGAFAVIFLVVILLIIRARVVDPARRKAEAKKAVFEPAGVDAEITFDEPDFNVGPEPKRKKKDKTKHREEKAEASFEEDDEVSEPALADEPREEVYEDPLFDEPAPAEKKKNRSPFAGLFSRKPKEAEPREEESEPAIENVSLAEVSIESEDRIERPAESAARHEEPDPFARRLSDADDDLEAQRQLEEIEERERLEHEAGITHERREEKEHIYNSARENARREAEFERRKSEAALEQRLRSLTVMERTLAEKADTVRTDAHTAHERLGASLEERFAALSDQLNEKLEQAAAAQAANENEKPLGSTENALSGLAHFVSRELGEMRAATDEALERLSHRIDKLGAAPEGAAGLARQLANLNRILSERAAGATAGRIQLSDLIRSVLPAGRYEFRAPLPNGRNADCCIAPPGGGAPIAIDARYPVEAFDLYIRESADPGKEVHAANEYRRAVLRHIVDVAEKLIVPGATADSAMMFAPSEAIVNDLHAHFPDLVQDSYRARVWIVSPTSLMATLHTMSAVSAGIHDEGPSAPDGDETLLAEIDMLRQRVARHDDAEPESPAVAPVDTFHEFPPVPDHEEDYLDPEGREDEIVEPEVSSDDGENDIREAYPSLSPEEEAFERLEREEAVAETPENNAGAETDIEAESEPDDTPAAQASRPPFPLR